MLFNCAYVQDKYKRGVLMQWICWRWGGGGLEGKVEDTEAMHVLVVIALMITSMDGVMFNSAQSIQWP